MRKKLKVEISKDSNRLVFVDNKVVGYILLGRFIQETSRRHLFRLLNSKGIELDVYARLLHENVALWRLEFTDTKQILEMPFKNIPIVGILNPPHSAGYQYHVKLKDFVVKQPALQSEMFDGGSQKDATSNHV